MTTPAQPLVSGANITTSFTSLYTVAEGIDRASIDAAVFNNYSSSNVTITVRLVQAGTGDVFDEVITAKTIRAGENFLAPGIIGQGIGTGGTIQAKASANSSVNANITGTEIT